MIGGLALAIATVTRQVGGWGVVGWVISTVSAVHLLTARRTNSNDFHVRRPDPVLRAFVASVAVFCFTIFVIVAYISIVVRPGPIGQVDAIGFSVLAVVGTAAAAASLRWIWK